MTDSLLAIFDSAGVDAAFQAVDLATGRTIDHHADDLSIMASVFKVPVLVELCRQHAAGELDATAPVEIAAGGRTRGPYGLSVMHDRTVMSLRDLAWLMIGFSDNHATDVVCDHVGLDNVAAMLRRLGFEHTRVAGHCDDLFETVRVDLDLETLDGLRWPAVDLTRLRSCDPARALQVTTPREMNRLLGMVWAGEAAPAPACAEVRRILGLQVWPHRLSSGFMDDDDVKVSGKTGTLAAVRNEVGVVEYPDGGRYAVSVFTTARTVRAKDPAADAAIGRAGRLAVDMLRNG